MKAKKSISILLVLTMICSLFISAVPVSAEEEVHSHPVCGASCTGDHDGEWGDNDSHTEIIEWTALTQAMLDAASGSYLQLSSGNYYLAEDITTDKYIQIQAENVNLCLNGKTFSTNLPYDAAIDYYGSYAGTYNICDCIGNGLVTNADDSAISNSKEQSTLNIYGGSFHSGDYDGLSIECAELNIYDGTITTASDYCYGALHIMGDCSAYIYGGTIKNPGNADDCGILTNSSSVNLYVYGGTIEGTGQCESAISSWGMLHLGGAPKIVGDILLDDDTPIYIEGPLTYTEPVSVGYMYSAISPFTSGWSTHMPDAYAPSYFVSTDSSKAANANADGELEFVDKTIRVNASNASVQASNWLALESEEVTLTIKPDEGYEISGITARDANWTTVAVTDNGDGNYSLTMGAPTVTVNASVTKIPHNITVADDIVGATVTPTVTTAGIDDEVELTITPDHGYKLESLTVTDAEGNDIETTKVGEDDTKYTFTMPNSAVTVDATFKHCHPVCGATCAGDHDGEYGDNDGHTEDIDWTALTQEMVTNNSEAAVALTAGNYYLAGNITLGEHYFTTTGTVNICLNGYTMSTADADYCIMLDAATAVMNLTDCGTTGTVDSSASGMSSALQISNGGTVNIYGGTYGGTGTAQWYTAELTSGGVLKLYNGTLKDVAETYGCVYVDGSSFYMYGGTVSSDKRTAVAVGPTYDDAFAYIYGGTLTAGSDNEYPVIDLGNGELHIAGAPVFNGPGEHIRLTNLGSGNILHIDAPLTTSTPIVVYDMYSGNNYYDFTTGWKTHMSTAYAPEFFSNYSYDSDSMVVAVNEATGELHFVDESKAPKKITVAEGIENGTVEAPVAVKSGAEVTLTVTPAEGYAVESVTATDTDSNVTNAVADTEDATKYTFTMPATEATVSATFKAIDYSVNIPSSFVGGKVTADNTTANIGDVITLTATPVSGYEFTSLTVTDAEGNEINTVSALADATQISFEMPASSVTVDAVFTMKSITDVFTVEAVVNASTTDVDTADEDMDVYAGNTVEIDVIVNGADYTNADWTLVYDSSKFKYVETKQNEDFALLGYYVLDDSNADGNVLTGSISGQAGNSAKADEFTDGGVVVTYVFEAISQLNEVTGKFNITEAHANTYEMAGVQDNTAATSAAVDVTILLVDEDATVTVPAGSIEDKETDYNALEQAGNEYVLEEQFADATVTYYANEDGSAVADSNADGVIDATELDGFTFRTGLPTWKDVGTYTYYVKVSGNGLATIYDSATLTIKPATLTPSATFAVDPDVNKVTITPVLEGVLDGTHNGTVTVKYTDATGTEQTETLNASDFVYDGESTSVYNGSIEVEAQASGTFTVTLDYTEGTDDNYTGEQNTATVDVDKITAEDATVEALEDAITSEFPYDSEAHSVVIGDLTAITDGTWTATSITDAYDGTENPTVTNVGDDKLVKVVFTDSTGVYNDVVVYVILKVTPADVRIIIDDKSKAVGEDDPEFTYTLEVLDEDGNVVKTNELYSTDDLTALALELEREPGEAAGTYTITATYVPNANYNVTVIDGQLEIGAPEIGVDGDVKIEVVDLSNETDGTPDYIADKRLILVYTNLDKVYYGYGDDAETAERMFDVTAAGYKYVDNVYVDNVLTTTADDTAYAHVYGIVVDKIDTYEATEEYEKQYLDKVIFLGSDAADAPENIVYDADINLTEELDINDYSMNNGIYNVAYDRAAYIRSILKADYNHDKVVDTDDSLAVKGIVDVAVE